MVISSEQKEQSLKKELIPFQSALLVVDVQNDFCDSKGKFSEWGRSVEQMQSIVPYIQGLITVAHKALVPVIFAKGYEDIKFRTGPDLLRAEVLGEKDDGEINSLEGTWGAELYILQPEERDIIIEKHKWSAFDGKDKDKNFLGAILKRLGVSTIVVTGVVAETCVETTIRDAYSRNYYVIVPENCVGSDNPDQLKARMDYWRRGFVANVVTEDFLKKTWLPPQP